MKNLVPTFALRSTLLGIALTGLAHAQANPNITLRAPNLIAQPGQTVTVPVQLDNNLGLIQGWSFSCNITSPLAVVREGPGSTTAALNGGAGPNFLVARIYPGQGYTVGCVISYAGNNPLPVGSAYELHTCDVAIPANAAPGTVYPIRFDSPAFGSPPVATVMVMGGFSYRPTIVPGSITVGTRATVTAVAASDCPGAPMGTLASSGSPRLGGTWTLQVQRLPRAATHGFYVFGFRLQPRSLASSGSPCTVYPTTDLILLRLRSGNDLAGFSLRVPQSPALSGASLYVQALHDGAPVPPFSGFLGSSVAYYFTNTIEGRVGF